MFDVLNCILYEGVVLEVVVEQDSQSVRFMANYERDGDTITLRALHVEGPGSNSTGIAGLRLVGQQVLEFLNARFLEVHGAPRTTGINPGRTPMALRFSRQ
jgi:hypothetical protein